jgi:hypothetical protein
MPWYLLSGGTPYYSPSPRSDLGPEIPEPGSEPEKKAEPTPAPAPKPEKAGKK